MFTRESPQIVSTTRPNVRTLCDSYTYSYFRFSLCICNFFL